MPISHRDTDLQCLTLRRSAEIEQLGRQPVEWRLAPPGAIERGGDGIGRPHLSRVEYIREDRRSPFGQLK
jgi:hypothetical protein